MSRGPARVACCKTRVGQCCHSIERGPGCHCGVATANDSGWSVPLPKAISTLQRLRTTNAAGTTDSARSPCCSDVSSRSTRCQALCFPSLGKGIEGRLNAEMPPATSHTGHRRAERKPARRSAARLAPLSARPRNSSRGDSGFLSPAHGEPRGLCAARSPGLCPCRRLEICSASAARQLCGHKMPKIQSSDR